MVEQLSSIAHSSTIQTKATCTKRSFQVGVFLISILLITTIFLQLVGHAGINEAASNSNNYSMISDLPIIQISYNGRADPDGIDTKTQYLIITPTEFLSIVEPLAAWKTQKGVYTSIAVLDGSNGINSTYFGHDLAAKIHMFLRDYYNNTPNLKWLLLVGDSEIIPSRLLLTNNASTGAGLENINNFCYSDYYYSALDSTWDNNSNYVYGESGEEDFVPELYVGRIPVGNILEAENAVNNILTYEKDPPIGDWLNKMMLIGALMDRPNILDNPYTQNVDEGYNWYKDNAYEVIRKIWDYIPPQMQDVTFLDYDRIQGGDYSRKNDTLNASNFLSAYNDGASVVNLVSHGNDNGVLHYNGKDGTGNSFDFFFNHDMATNVENGFKLPLVYSSSCTSGNFSETDDSNLEYLISSGDGGAIGFIGATADTYRLEFLEDGKESSFGNWWLNAEFWYRFFNGAGRFRPGEILYDLKADYYLHYTSLENPHTEQTYYKLYRVNQFAYNLLGDPEIPIYTKSPDKLKVEYNTKFSPVYRRSEFTIKVLDNTTGEPVYDADVCLTGENDYLVTRTDQFGNAKFDMTITEPTIYHLTVTAHNYLYHQGTVRVEGQEDLSIKVEDLNFDKNPVPPEATVNISFRIFNNGTSDISDLKVNCYFDAISPENMIDQTKIIKKLRMGEYRNLSVNWTLEAGSHNIIIFIDPYEEIFEFDESNNIVQSMLIENTPPIIINLPDMIIDEDTIALDELDLSQFTWDMDTNELQFFISSISDPDFNITINNTLVSFYPPADWNGTVAVVFGVFDGTSFDFDDLNIFVQPVNDAPVINDTMDWVVQSDNVTVTVDHISVLEDIFVDITAVAYDKDDDTGDLRFGAETKLFQIDPITGRLQFIPGNSDVGTHNINFTVYDGHNQHNRSWRDVTFEILNVNDPPELLVDDHHFIITTGETFEVWITARDEDNDNDTLRFTDDSDLFEIDPTTGHIRFKPKEGQIGVHHVTITVSDGNLSDEVTIMFEIKGALEDPLPALVILMCPVILVIILIILISQEYFKYKRKNKKMFRKKDND